MIDQYGDISPEALNQFVKNVGKNFDKLSNILVELLAERDFSSFYEAKVEAHCGKDSKEEKLYGFGAVQVTVPDLGIAKTNNVWARPHRLLSGRFEFPPIGSWVKVIHRQHNQDFMEYYGAYFLDMDDFYATYTSKEPIGFGPAQKVGKMESVGPYLDKVRTKPAQYRILESSSNMVIFEDGVSKVVEIRVNDGWKIKLIAGSATNTDTITEKTVLGETLKGKLEEILDAIVAHKHPTGTGPSGPPDNAMTFTSVKGQLSSTLSAKMRNS